MKQDQIHVGRIYLAKVNNRVTRVRVDSTSHDYRGRQTYHVTNLATGRQTHFRSAAKFRSAVGM